MSDVQFLKDLGYTVDGFEWGWQVSGLGMEPTQMTPIQLMKFAKSKGWTK
jgi:hypothetical protein